MITEIQNSGEGHQVTNELTSAGHEIPANDNNRSLTSYEEAIGEIEASTEPDSVAVLEVQPSPGRSHFTPKLSSSSKVELRNALGDDPILFIKRTSKSPGEGGTIDGKTVEAEFGEDIFTKYNHRQEVAIVLADGRQIPGYLVKSTSKKAVYLPKPFLPAGIVLPELGTRLPVRVKLMLLMVG